MCRETTHCQVQVLILGSISLAYTTTETNTMSRNLCKSSCPHCGYLVRLSDLRGKPVEFRRYSQYAPVLGVRFDCPCGQIYFAAWEHKDVSWSHEQLQNGQWNKPTFDFEIHGKAVSVPNYDQGRYAFKTGSGSVENMGYFTIDLSYYETYDDEMGMPLKDREEPAHLCKDNAEDAQCIL